MQLSVDSRTSHTYICEHHKQIIQSIRTNGRRKRHDDGIGVDDDLFSINDLNGMNDSPSNDLSSSNHHNHHSASSNHHNHHRTSHHHSKLDRDNLMTDFNNLSVNTLRKYKRFYRLPIKHGVNKNQLADVRESILNLYL